MNVTPIDPSRIPPNTKDFLLKEYECLRKEVEWLLKDYRGLERNIVVAVAVLWSWLFHEKWDAASGRNLHTLAWFIPFLFAVLGSVRARGIFKAFGVLHDYLLEIEETFTTDSYPQGWEHFLTPKEEPAKAGGSRDLHRKTGASTAAFTFWGILDSVTLLLAVMVACHVR
jgi:hypothetical protein